MLSFISWSCLGGNVGFEVQQNDDDDDADDDGKDNYIRFTVI